jgi:ech hydrogenase subunit A
MEILAFLVLCPLVIAILLFILKNDKVRDVLVIAGAIVIAVASIYLVVIGLMSGPTQFELESHIIDYIGTAIGVLIAVVILYFAIRFKNVLAGLLAVVQVALSLVFELVYAPHCPVEIGLYYDNLSLLMAFIIGVVGSGICVYALGYMKDFQRHEPEGAKDRRPFFFGLMFLFLSAMYVIVFSNNMVWLFTGWEVTTVCSFLLIGYTRTEEALRNAFRQINMNLLGGIGFVLALYACVIQMGTLDLAKFIELGTAAPAIAIFAVASLSFAGLTKAAQMPFHTWLLGAMVAPTPTSALLHSSTMVKAGVFLLVKLSPVLMMCTIPSYLVIIVGGFTFLMCSLLAISQSNAKRVLAYSTIANLGLITACAGVGTPEAVWAAMFLILFHAVAKSLLFLCVGTAEHHIGSRNIEDMDLLFERMPRLARFMMLGIMCMFIAPLGMLVAKWATLVSLVDSQQVLLIVMLAFGSAATFMFWTKWFGKLAGIAYHPENVELTVHKSEWAAIITMVVLIVVCCVGLPLLSNNIVEPYITSTYCDPNNASMMVYFSERFGIDALTTYLDSQSIASGNLGLCALLSLVVIVVILGGLGAKTNQRKVSVYLAGASADNEKRTYRNSLSGVSEATARNWYMEDYFGEKKLTVPSQVGASVYITVLYVVSLVFSIMAM